MIYNSVVIFRTLGALSLVLCLFFAAGCGGNGTTVITANNFTGSYTGTETVNSVAIPLTLIIGSDGTVTGTFTSPTHGTGNITGTIQTSGFYTFTAVYSGFQSTDRGTASFGTNAHLIGAGTQATSAGTVSVSFDLIKN